MDTLLSLSRYVDTLRKLTNLAPGIDGIRYFIATDDVEAETILRSSFEDGRVQDGNTLVVVSGSEPRMIQLPLPILLQAVWISWKG